MKINGLKVVDAKKKMVIHIGPQDIRKGKNKQPDSCAAALSCLREIEGCTEAKVHIGRTYLRIGKKWLRFHTPQSLRSEIVAFDRGARFEPGRYVLAPMQPTKKATGKRQGGAFKRRTGQSRRPYHQVEGVREFSGYQL